MIAILWKIRQAGGKVVVRDGKVRIETPVGLLSDGDKQVLAHHKQDLLRLLAAAEQVVVDPEREAIEWIERLPAAEAEAVVATALREWREIVSETPTVVVDAVEETQAVEWEDTIEPPPPCETCGSLELWQSMAGTWQCLGCDPPTKARRLRERAARLREKRLITIETIERADRIKAEPNQDWGPARLLTTTQT